MSSIDDIAERHALWKIVAAGGAAVLLVGAGSAWVDGMASPASALVASAVVVIAGVLARARWQMDRMPLEVGRLAAREVVEGVDVIRVRVRLGRGRTMRDAQAQVRWTSRGRLPVVLDAQIPAEVLCGTWTVTARDPDQVVEGPGCLSLVVHVREGARKWKVERRFDAEEFQRGRFAPVGGTKGGRFCFDHGRWDTIHEEGDR